MNIKEIFNEIESKRKLLRELYRQLKKSELKKTHLLKDRKKEIARLYTQINAKGDTSNG